MKLQHVLLRDRLPALGSSSFTASEVVELTFEAGLVTIRRLDRDEPAWVVPVSNVTVMRPAPGKVK